MITTLIFNLLLGGWGEKNSSRKGREICFSSNCLYFTQTCEKFLRGCKSSPLHTLLKRSDFKNPPHRRDPLGFPPLSAVAAWLATFLLSCAAGQGETGPKDYRHFPATSKAKRREKVKGESLFHVASLINRRECRSSAELPKRCSERACWTPMHIHANHSPAHPGELHKPGFLLAASWQSPTPRGAGLAALGFVSSHSGCRCRW